MPLSKTTTLTCSSASMADMMVLNSRTNCGPIRLSGGLSNVIRQYAGDVRLILICAALVTVLITTSAVGDQLHTGITQDGTRQIYWTLVSRLARIRAGAESVTARIRARFTGGPNMRSRGDDQRRSLRCHRLKPDQLRATLICLENRSP